MPKRFKSIWGEKKSARTIGRPAASAEADSESGDEGADPAKELYALEIMRKRGLISEEEYARRLATIVARGGA